MNVRTRMTDARRALGASAWTLSVEGRRNGALSGDSSAGRARSGFEDHGDRPRSRGNPKGLFGGTAESNYGASDLDASADHPPAVVFCFDNHSSVT